MDIHVKTTYFVVAIMYVLLPSITWIALYSQRRQSTNTWCSAGVVTGFSFGVFWLRGLLPTETILIIANVGLICGSALHVQALRMDLGIPWKKPIPILIGLLCGVLYYLNGIFTPPASYARFSGIYAIYFVLSYLLGSIAMYSWRIYRITKSPSAVAVCLSYLFVLLALFVRQIAIFTGIDTGSAFASEPSAQVLMISIILAAVIAHVGYVGVELDRTRQRELRAAQEQTRQEVTRALSQQISHLDRQRGLGMMAKSLAHELRQPLSAALGEIQLCGRGLTNGTLPVPQAVEILNRSASNIKRIQQILQRIVGFIRPTELERSDVDIGDSLKEAIDLVRHDLFIEKVKCDIAPISGRLSAVCDKVQLSQVFVNVLRNSVDAMKLSDDAPKQRSIHIVAFEQGDKVIIRMRDNGPGVPPDVIDRICTPFFTTKSSGLGMGLSISKSIMENFGGSLTIDNDTDGGAVVELQLPNSSSVAL